ncbi:peptidase [Streptomyces antibioticus]|nr:S8 family serine peptidase [Streptomyces antibioticus]KUN18807.1 peptidase [Streptomyces antibioticus]
MTLPTSRRRGSTALGAAAAALATALLPLAASAAPGHPPDLSVPSTTPAPSGAAGSPRTVTLVTGDKVTVTTTADGRTTVTVTGPDGRPAGAHVMTQGKDIRVYPDAALPYMASGALDPDLFDVRKLLADGYDDAHSDHLPLIVTYTDAAFRSRTTPVPEGARRTLGLDSVHGAALSASHASASAFWASLTGRSAVGARTGSAAGALAGGIAKVWLDGKATAQLADSTAQIGAPEVWRDGNTGQGVDVAVLDTGVDDTHPDLAGRIAASASFVPGESVEDRNGHGTHVASTVAGTGAASGGKERGVAPGASLRIGKVLGDDGSGLDSWIIAGMEWAARDQHAKVVSMSLGSGPSDGSDPLSQAVNRLSADTGALFVIAAGNAGPGPSTVSTPGTADAALTVGAVNGSDQPAAFSSRGPRKDNGGLKPDLTAPGVDIRAARARNSPGEGSYVTHSGTSMATPHVAGAAALLARAHPGWTGQQLKDALVSTTAATPKYSPYTAGSGRLDAEAAVHDTVFATGSALAFAPWPHQPGDTLRRDVTYTNTGAAPVTLDLTLSAPGAPAGLFALTGSRVTVPAHGTAAVGVLTHLDTAADDVSYSGFLTAAATDGTAHVRTSLGALEESRRSKLSITTRDRHRSGLPGQLVLKDITRDTAPRVYDVDDSGRLDVRLRPGTYAAWMYADITGLDSAHSLSRAVLTAPEVVVDGDRNLVLDAARLRRLTAVTPKPTADAYVRLDQDRSYGDLVPFHEGYQLEPWAYDSLWATPTPEVTQGSYTFTTRWRQVQPPLTVAAGSHGYRSVLPQSLSPKPPEGSGSYRAVDAGEGSAADFARVAARDRVAVVRRSDTVSPVDQAAAAAAAGARLLLIVNNGTGPLDAWADLPEGAPLPVASLGTDEGRDLLARLRPGRTTTLRVTSHPYPGYLYDLLLRHDGSVPRDLTYRPGPGELARIDVADRDTRQGVAVDWRYDLSPDATWAVGAPLTPVRAQGSYTTWVTAGPDALWIEAASVPDLTETGGARTYRPRSAGATTWFAPVPHPRLRGDSVLTLPPSRVGDLISLYGLPAYGDSGGHVGSVFETGATVRAALYQGDTLIAEGDDHLAAEVAPDTLPYRLVQDTARDLPGRPYATRTHTEWAFRSERAGDTALQPLPLVQVDYSVATDLSGKAGRRTELTVTPSHLAGVAGSRFLSVALDVSYDDGATWHRADPRRASGEGVRFRLDAPARARFVTLRASARDDAGDAVTQTVVRAFGLR